jgi:hypothetical protein
MSSLFVLVMLERHHEETAVTRGEAYHSGTPPSCAHCTRSLSTSDRVRSTHEVHRSLKDTDYEEPPQQVCVSGQMIVTDNVAWKLKI